MGDLAKRVFPGVAVAAVAVGSVAGLDAAIQQREAPAADAGTGAAANPDAPAASQSGACTVTQPSTGDAAMTPWGPVQVEVEVDGSGQVCAVRAVTYPNGDRKSAEINSRAVPLLNRDALQQGVEFDSVSGATYTSEAYRDSLQSVLDAL